MIAFQDLETFKRADADRGDNLRGLVRTGRRIFNRCWKDSFNINRTRIFCQNSGACGSTYIVRLLEANGLRGVFHEKQPDLLKLGLDFYEREMPWLRLISLLRYTRHDINFEASNRLFSLSRPLADAFPGARFIFLHRDGIETIRSVLSKPNVAQYFREDVRFRGTLAGDHNLDIFSRACHHWSNMNRRIHEDLQYLDLTQQIDAPTLRFENLIDGNIQPLEDALQTTLRIKTCAPANQSKPSGQLRFPAYTEWTRIQKKTFQTICGETMALLGR